MVALNIIKVSTASSAIVYLKSKCNVFLARWNQAMIVTAIVA